MKVSSPTNKRLGGLPLKTLMVEDSEDDTLLIIRKLQKGGYKPIFRRVDTHKALKNALETEKWDIVISDYIMPKFSGLDALKLLKEKNLDIPFIIVSGNIGEDIAVKAMIAGAHDYIMKDNLSRLIPAITRELREADVRRERRNTEKALYESEELYRSLVELSPDAVTVLRDNKIVYVNPACVHIAGGSTSKEFIGKPILSFIHPDCHDLFIKHRNIIKNEGKPIKLTEEKFLKLDGQTYYVEAVSTPIIYQKLPSVMVVFRDITERKKAEEALKESEKNYRDLVDNALVGVYKTNMDGEILFTNEALATLLEYETVEEVMALNINSIYKNLKEREDLLVLLKGEGKIEEYEVELLTKSGKTLKVILSAKFDGISISGMMMDITERKNAENTIKKSLDEKEVLIREIHHRVKNNMQIISSLLSLQSRSIDDKKTFELFRDSQNRVRSMALIHEKLYQSDNLAEIDFKEYIKNLTTDLIRSYGVTPGTISLSINVNKVSLGVNTAIPCGLIINELLTNSIKHAFPDGKKGKINIELHQITENEYMLIFNDNGIGLPENFEFKNIKSLGLRLVNSLTDQLNGKIDLEIVNGTKFIITFMRK